MMVEEMYTSGAYLEKWPTWHVEISPWSARQIFRMMKRNNLAPKTICEVGCGAGEVLKQLQLRMNDECTFRGYEISPQAIELCKSRANERLQFILADFRQEKDVFFDLMLIIDVIEHVEDYFSFMRDIQPKSAYKIIHIPMDLTMKSFFRGRLLELRREHGHIHYFTKDIALAMLQSVGYEVLDYFYTTPSIDLPTVGGINEIRRRFMKLPRKLLFAMHEDVAAQTLGGCSLMVLAK
ncbi:MAG: class I SAM-dependent methyltransferase [Ktedonobacteraceae bacterium]